MKTKRKLWEPLAVIFVMIFFFIYIAWKDPLLLWVKELNSSVILRVENLNLPEDYVTVYPTKAWISDVYWWHVKAEKVIKCNMGYEAAKEYIETHNSEDALKYIDIYPYGGMSDIAIYDSEFDKEFWEQPDRDNYIVVSYFRKILD
ncbi:MAG: hypothetical protein K2J04_02780 [Lachnospiraceae bacterium]|nr:hypothetical protein [Lachnospiraceae bacterium]